MMGEQRNRTQGFFGENKSKSGFEMDSKKTFYPFAALGYEFLIRVSHFSNNPMHKKALRIFDGAISHKNCSFRDRVPLS